MGIDEAKCQFDLLSEEWMRNYINFETEQDARFQIIDRMLTQVLGWQYSEIKTEPHTDSGFIDYLITDQGRNRFVVEAKRISHILVDTKIPKVSSYKVKGTALSSAADGFDQAKRYCSDTGVLFSGPHDRVEWIAYWAIRTDGTPPSEGKAIVFLLLRQSMKNLPCSMIFSHEKGFCITFIKFGFMRLKDSKLDILNHYHLSLRQMK